MPKGRPPSQINKKVDVSESVIKLLEFYDSLKPYPQHPIGTLLVKLKKQDYVLDDFELRQLLLIKDNANKLIPDLMLYKAEWQPLLDKIAELPNPDSIES